ncbi:MAG: DUF4105 domain-containing protein [Cyclobacteriaceae bacterium]
MHARIIAVLLFILSFLQPTFSQVPSKGENMEIAIMTLGPYQGELYSAFGHSAIRIVDTTRNFDYVFNYGVFNFNQDNFYWNFARGKMLYQLGLAKYDRFVNHYINENRYVIEQYLNLTPAEKAQLNDYLFENYKPENREYYYNYVYNNCSSKIMDVLRDAIDREVTFSYDYVEEGISVRDLMDKYLAYQPWGDWVIDIGLGMQIDGVAAPETYMFLPDYVEKSLAKATIATDSSAAPLLSKTVNVYTPTPEEHANSMFTPFNTFVIIFFIVGFITNRDFKKGKRSHWIDVVFFTFVGIIGWWVAFLWIGTEHLSKNNLNILWATPLHIPFIYLLNVARFRKFISKYFLACAILYLVVLVIWGLIPQPLHMAMIPIMLTMILRAFFIYHDVNRTGSKGF